MTVDIHRDMYGHTHIFPAHVLDKCVMFTLHPVNGFALSIDVAG